MKKIRNPLTEDQIESLWIKEISNASIAEKKVILNLNVEQNQRTEQGIELIIEILGF